MGPPRSTILHGIEYFAWDDGVNASCDGCAFDYDWNSKSDCSAIRQTSGCRSGLNRMMQVIWLTEKDYAIKRLKG